jgi:hypothetical protein
MSLSKFSLQFEDPLEGAGGFGASTAELVMLYEAYLNCSGDTDRSWIKLWKLYRDLMKDEALLPSGADLIAQKEGSIVLVDIVKEQCTSLWRKMDWSNLLIFSATQQKGRKVATHEHLALLSENGFPNPNSELTHSLRDLMNQGIQAIESQDLVSFGRTMDSYAETLGKAKLELLATYEDRQVLRSLPHVLGVKGAGALQADAILVLMKPNSDSKKALITIAESRGLRWVNQGITEEPGISVE